MDEDRNQGISAATAPGSRTDDLVKEFEHQGETIEVRVIHRYETHKKLSGMGTRLVSIVDQLCFTVGKTFKYKFFIFGKDLENWRYLIPLGLGWKEWQIDPAGGTFKFSREKMGDDGMLVYSASLGAHTGFLIPPAMIRPIIDFLKTAY